MRSMAERGAIQNSQESLIWLAKRYGINPKTVAKWRKRSSVVDMPTGPSLSEVKTFNRFEKGNDPYGEHDFGSIKLEGTTFFWMIDDYDLAMSQHSVDPANGDATIRVLTIMCANEY